jgi:putative ABC transport system ATP-binding protein
MKQALEIGNRTLLMADGNIVYDVKGEEREGLTVDDLLIKFKTGTGKALDNDRMLLS